VTGKELNDAIDVGTCEAAHLHKWLPLGSAWVRVEPTPDACQLWLGGETENPMYDGSASQYCAFKRECADGAAKTNTIAIPVGSGGPAHLTHSACTP
jgi:hypothetical protein